MAKILVIDDYDDVRENIRLILKKAGYEILTAASGSEGLKLAFENDPDLIICDIMMPEMDGYEVFKLLSVNKRTAGIPFIFLTALGSMSDLRKGMNLGATDYLIKPFSFDDLLNSIKVRLAQKQKNLELQQEVFQNLLAAHQLKLNSVIMVGNPPEILKVSSIIYITADGGYTNLLRKDGKPLLVRKLIKEWEKLLPEDNFIRIHNSTIINRQFIEKVDKFSNSTLRVYMYSINKPLVVSRRYTAKVKSRLRI